jgi:type VI secretion system protein ImpL
MARFLVTALKIFLLLALAAAAAVGAMVLARYEGWPLWSAAVAVATLFALIFLGLFLRRLYYRRREAEFVKRVVSQDQKSVEAAPAHERRRLQDLQDRWTAAVRLLKSSKLRRRGDPLYTLPWFMIFGETASGKSTAVSPPRLPSIRTAAGPAQGIAGTRNCDWWFVEAAVILDTAGRYAIPIDEEADREEWERFLSLLGRYRRREPLSGLIVTLPADRLLAGDTDSLAEYGRSIRRRVDQLMRILGAKFPVYVLLTKLDLVLGMTALCDLLPEAERGQAMGLLNGNELRAPEEFTGEALAHISRRLKDMRLLLGASTGRTDGKAALFPDEFERLFPLILSFVEGAFHENPYQETPFLRGLFVSSGRQSGMARSGVLGGLESFKDKEWRLPDTGRGLFLHDIFSTILPRERGLFKRIDEYLSWRTATRNLGLAAWLLVLLAGVGLSSLAYVQIRDAVDQVHAAFPKAPRLGLELTNDLIQVELLRDKIADMEKTLHKGFWPKMGLNQGDELLAAFKRQYCAWFREYVLQPTDKTMNGRFANMDHATRATVMAQSLEYLVWRIDTIRGREKGRAPETGGGPVDALALAFGGKLPDVAAFFPEMYHSYVAWEENTALLQREARELETWTAWLIDVEGANLHWLTDWAAAKPDLPDLTLDDFWPGLGHARPEVQVDGAYTAAGKAKIAALLTQVSEAMTQADNREAFARREESFWIWYQERFYGEWELFAMDFDLGLEKLITREGWQNAGASMSTLDNPYFRLLERMKTEFDSVEKIAPPPPWAVIPERFSAMLGYYRAGQKQATLGSKVESEVKERVAKAVGAFDEHVMSRLSQVVDSVTSFQDYMKQLAAFQPVTASEDAAFRFTSKHFGTGGAPVPEQPGQVGAVSGGGQPSPVDEALSKLQHMRLLLSDGKSSEEAVWHLVEGPLTFLVTLATYETACGLNQLWEAQVLAEVRAVPAANLWETLFGQQGVVNSFVAGPAKPFLRRDTKGWFGGAWLGVPFPFEESFLKLIDQGATRRQQVQPKYTVRVTALPTNVNPEAHSRPFLVSLTLQCVDKPQQLDNYNYQDSLDFTWAPATCGDVTLKIDLREVSVTRTWPGPWGFRAFLRDFRDGREVFTPKDFPDKQAILEGLGVERIQVNYKINGADPVLGISEYPALRLPQRVANCNAGLGAVVSRDLDGDEDTPAEEPGVEASAPPSMPSPGGAP